MSLSSYLYRVGTLGANISRCLIGTAMRSPGSRTLWTSISSSSSSPSSAASCVGRTQQGPTLLNTLQTSLSLPQNALQVRTNVRVHYKPNAYKRITKHGYKKRISTKKGLSIIWRRFLKGRHELWH